MGQAWGVNKVGLKFRAVSGWRVFTMSGENPWNILESSCFLTNSLFPIIRFLWKVRAAFIDTLYS